MPENFNPYPLITVVIPVYNREELVLRAVQSVLDQTYPCFELIIADDGSTDLTRRRAGSVRDPRVKLLELEHTGHIGFVRNAGAAAGSGEWIAFLDSDDTWLPDKLELQLLELRSSGMRWCYTGFELTDSHGQTLPPRAGSFRPIPGHITENLLRHETAVIICTLLMQRSLYEEAGGFSTDRRLHVRGDYELALRISAMAPGAVVPAPLVRVLEHPGRVTRSLDNPWEKSSAAYQVFLEKHPQPGWRKIARRQKAWLLSEAAVQRSARGEYLRAVQHLAGAASRDQWRHWLSACYRSFKAALQ